MERQMRRMGVDFQQLEEVTEVLIRFPDKELVIPEAQVIKMQAQDEDVFQVVGKSEERNLTISAEPEEGAPATTVQTFTEEDVQLVATQANVSEDEARKALRGAEGNLAKAIIALTEK